MHSTCRPVGSAPRALLPASHRPRVRERHTAVATVAARAAEEDVEAMEKAVKKTSLKAERAARRAVKMGTDKPFQVDAPVRDAIASGDLTEDQVVEGRFLSALFIIFSICILEGLTVGASGFLPEAADQFVQDYVYTAFSPTIAFFLLCSTAYGLWKSKQDGTA